MVELRLPVRRIPVILVLADGHRQDASVFLAAGQDPGDLLAGEPPFLPVHTAGRIRLYARAAIACVAVPPGPSGDDGADLPIERRPVVVHLASAVVLAGELRFVQPPERCRTADVLNEPAPTFSLHSGEVVYHVAKRHVTWVEEA